MDNDQKMLEELKKVAQPLYSWFIENCDFHQSIVIDEDGIKLMSDTIFIPVKGKE